MHNSGFFPKKLKDSTNFGVIYCKNQRKWPKTKGETTKIPKSRMKGSKYYGKGTILKQKYLVFEVFRHFLKTQAKKSRFRQIHLVYLPKVGRIKKPGLNGVLRHPCLACHTWRCPSISEAPVDTHKVLLRTLQGRHVRSKSTKLSQKWISRKNGVSVQTCRREVLGTSLWRWRWSRRSLHLPHQQFHPRVMTRRCH